MTTNSPATPLPLKLAVQWEDTFVRLHTIGSNPYDCAIGSSKDSTRGKLFTVIADRCNAYPQLVEALRRIVDSGEINTDAASYIEAIALLRSLGEKV